MASGNVVDSDSHIFEPADLWEKNLEPKYRRRALCIRKDEEGLDYVSIGAKKSTFFCGPKWTTSFAGIGKSQKWRREYADLPYTELGSFVPGAVDPPMAYDIVYHSRACCRFIFGFYVGLA